MTSGTNFISVGFSKSGELPPTISAYCHMLGWIVLPLFPFTKAKHQLWQVTRFLPGTDAIVRETFYVDGTRFADWNAVFKKFNSTASINKTAVRSGFVSS